MPVLLFMLIVFLGDAAICPARQSPSPVRRFVMAIGANHGGPERMELRYAVSDARAFSEVLLEMGGVLPEDLIILAEPDRRALFAEFGSLQKMVTLARDDRDKVEVIIYYSGHSDQNHLLFKKDSFSYRELRQQIDRLAADVMIAILDSCASGAITRIRGGVKRPPFLFDSAFDMKGRAFITSSSADEVAQESDQIKASFFTHNLVSGLRGAADLNQDGKITLNEAYQYAFHETLHQTRETLRGPQHPNYNIEMTGTGDVIITDVRKSSSLIVFSEEVMGRLFIYDQRENLVVELNKPAGRPIEIGLPPGVYRISNIRGEKLYAVEIDLVEDASLQIVPEMLLSRERTPARTRGDQDLSTGEVEPEMTVIPFRLSLIDLPLADHRQIRLRFAVSLVLTSAAELDGVASSSGATLFYGLARGWQISSAFNKSGSLRGVQISGGANFSVEQAQGGQIAGAFNYAGALKGVQISSVFNIVDKEMRGIQISAGANLAETLSGVQISSGINISGNLAWGLQLGTINLCRETNGVQVGVVNIADTVKGTQLGVINVARRNEGGSFGVLNISGNGFLKARFEIDEIGFSNAGISHGNRNLFSSYFFGHNLVSGQQSAGMGLGTMLSIGGALDLSVEAVARSVYRRRRLFRESGLLSSLRATLTYELLPSLELFASASYNFFHNLGNPGITIPKPFHRAYFIENQRYKHWLGLAAGLQANLAGSSKRDLRNKTE